jgi:hypothetical protein
VGATSFWGEGHDWGEKRSWCRGVGIWVPQGFALSAHVQCKDMFQDVMGRGKEDEKWESGKGVEETEKGNGQKRK